MRRALVLVGAFLCLAANQARAADADAPAPQQKVGKLPHIEFNPRTRQVRVECEMLAVNAPLEFFCCVKGFNDYEAMVRSEVKPSHLHTALLAIGLQPGQPIRFSEATQKWLPPQGPPLQISMEYEKNGKTIVDPAWRWMRDVKTRKPAPPFTWVFTGSRVLPDGKYAADMAGYLVSIVNFELTVIDVPELASSSNELLEWERNPDVTPKAGATVWMIIEPVGNDHAKPAGQPATSTSQTPGRKSDDPPPASPTTRAAADEQVRAAEENINRLRHQWEQKVAPEREALRQAAEAHYKVIQDLRTQQQKLIDEADRIQRTIDELEKEYQDLTTPRPGK